MKSRLTVGALILGLFLFAGPQAWANNLLGNPGFEGGVPGGWSQAGPNWIGQAAVVRSGTIAAQNTIGTIEGFDYFASLFQEVTSLSPGQTIYATLWAKTNIDPRSSAVGGLLIEFYNGSTFISKKQSEIGGVANWRNLYVSTTIPANTTKVIYHAFVYATQAETTPPGGIALGGLAYFDEAVLSTDPIVPPPQQTALNNAGFENGLHDWTLLNSPGGSLLADDQVKYEGNYSAKNVIGHSITQTVFASTYQDLQYLSGKVYASAYVKTNFASTTAIAGIQIEYYNSSGSPIGTPNKAETSGTQDWLRLLIGGVTPPVGTATLRIHCYTFDPQNGSGQGKIANFDNVIFSYSPLNPLDHRTTILNPGFETNLSDWLDQYGFPATLSTVNHSEGHSAQKTIGVLTPARDYYSQIYQDIYSDSIGTPFSVNTPVYATAYVKTVMNPITKSKGGLQFEFIDDQGRVIEDVPGHPVVVNDSVGGNTDWRYLYITGLTPSGTQRVRVSGFEFARQQDASLAGDAYYDDFQFSLAPLAAPTPRGSLINPNFENGLNDWDELNFPAEVSTSPVHGGSYASVFTVSDRVLFGEDYFGRASQDIAVYPGRKVSAKIWVRTVIDPLTSSTAGLSLIFLDANGQQVGTETKQEVGNQPDWIQLAVDATAPSTVSKVRVGAFLFAAGGIGTPGDKAYFDDATLLLVTPRGCFLAGTPITMADGTQKPIENISVGDMVLAFDEETKQMKPDKVTEIFKHDQEDTYLVVNGHMNVTPIHRVFSKGNWTEIGKLKVGDTLTDAKGQDIAIQSIEVVNKKVDIYNFEVNPYHTYVADGVIVHNRKIPQQFAPADNNGPY